MPKLALKVDVDTLRGTREGVPRLIDILNRHQIKATFFAVGWIAGIHVCVTGLRRKSRLEKVKGLSNILFGPNMAPKFVTSTSYDYFLLALSVFYFSLLTIATFHLVFS